MRFDLLTSIFSVAWSLRLCSVDHDNCHLCVAVPTAPAAVVSHPLTPPPPPRQVNGPRMGADPTRSPELAAEIRSWVLNKSAGETALLRAAKLGYLVRERVTGGRVDWPMFHIPATGW